MSLKESHAFGFQHYNKQNEIIAKIVIKKKRRKTKWSFLKWPYLVDRILSLSINRLTSSPVA